MSTETAAAAAAVVTKTRQPKSLFDITVRIVALKVLPPLKDIECYLHSRLPNSVISHIWGYLHYMEIIHGTHPWTYLKSYLDYCVWCKGKNLPIKYTLGQWMIKITKIIDCPCPCCERSYPYFTIPPCDFISH